MIFIDDKTRETGFLYAITPKAAFALVYIAVVIYILIFRIIMDIVGRGETEFYPLEIITTIALLLTVLLTYLMYYEKRQGQRLQNEYNQSEKPQNGKLQNEKPQVATADGKSPERNFFRDLVTASKDTDEEKFHLALFIIFFAYLLAENNWLLGRETAPGTVIFGLVLLVMFVNILRRTYCMPSGSRHAFWLFLLGVLMLGVGTFFDLTMENQEEIVPFRVLDPNPFPFSRGLFEEVPEAFACLLFLHSMFLYHREITREKCYISLSGKDIAAIVVCAAVVGIGNSFLLEEHGETIWWRVAIGIVLYLTGLAMGRYYFREFFGDEGS